MVGGSLPDNEGRKNPWQSGAVEMYKATRYFTVTGNVIAGHESIADNPKAVDSLYQMVFGEPTKTKAKAKPSTNGYHFSTDADILAKIRVSKHAAKFNSLWAGDTTGYNGDDSRADLALCSILAFWVQGDAARIDGLFRQSGLMREKWGDRDDYRQRTIDKALSDKTEFYDPGPRVRINATFCANGTGRPQDQSADSHGEREPITFANFFVEEQVVGEKTVKVKIGYSADHLAKQLRAITDNWPKRVGRLLFVRDGDAPHYLESTTDTFAWIGRQLPSSIDNPLQWVGQGASLLPKAEFHAHLQQTGEVYDAVEAYPHYPLLANHYYIHPPVQGGDGKALARFLARFRPDSKHDAELLKAALLTLAVGLSPGDRPAFLLTGPDHDDRAGRGVGKTTFVNLASMLFGGYIVARDQDDMPDFIKRLLSPAARGKRVILIDNIKSLRFSWADLEAFVTSTTISGRQMFVGEGQIPNTFTVMLTINGATLSRDMAQRCVIVKLSRPEYSATWEEDAKADIEANRWAIIGDLIAELKKPAPPLARYSRWGAWERNVLSRLNDPAAIQKLIEERQGEADDDTEEADLIREAITQALWDAGNNPITQNVLIPSRRMAAIVNVAMGLKLPTNKMTAYLVTVQLPELRKSRRGYARGWTWNGTEAGMADTVKMGPEPLFGQRATGDAGDAGDGQFPL